MKTVFIWFLIGLGASFLLAYYGLGNDTNNAVLALSVSIPCAFEIFSKVERKHIDGA